MKRWFYWKCWYYRSVFGGKVLFLMLLFSSLRNDLRRYPYALWVRLSGFFCVGPDLEYTGDKALLAQHYKGRSKADER